jgi:hypothetical protein
VRRASLSLVDLDLNRCMILLGVNLVQSVGDKLLSSIPPSVLQFLVREGDMALGWSPGRPHHTEQRQGRAQRGDGVGTGVRSGLTGCSAQVMTRVELRSS